jgi:hypothetical protein
MREELTAYRIRDDDRNMSAPRRDTVLRVQFEFSRILRRYRAMSAPLLRNVFADELAANGISPDDPHELWLAELALSAGSPAHRLFALETLFETATHGAHMRRLRDLAGSIDLFGMQPAIETDARIAVLRKDAAAREATIAALDRAVAARDAEIAALRKDAAARGAEPKKTP